MLGGDHPGSSGQNWSAQAPSEPWPHHDQGLTSRAPVPDEDHPGLSRINWFVQAHQQPRPPSTESLQGGCPVEEEFLPNWVEFLPFLPSTVLERQPATCTTSPFQESVAMGCIVEEEALPLEDHSGRNSTASMEEDPVTDSVVAFQLRRCHLGGKPGSRGPQSPSSRLLQTHGRPPGFNL
jgi:hypothetical protein